MAETPVSRTILQGAYGLYTANAADITWQQADTANGNEVPISEGDILLAWNRDAVTLRTIAVGMEPFYGRGSGNMLYGIDAGEIMAFGPFERPGWAKPDGTLYFACGNANVYFAVLHVT